QAEILATRTAAKPRATRAGCPSFGSFDFISGPCRRPHAGRHAEYDAGSPDETHNACAPNAEAVSSPTESSHPSRQIDSRQEPTHPGPCARDRAGDVAHQQGQLAAAVLR